MPRSRTGNNDFANLGRAMRTVPLQWNLRKWIEEVRIAAGENGDAKWGSGHGVVTLRAVDLEGGGRPVAG